MRMFRAAAARALRLKTLIVSSRGAMEECISASTWTLRVEKLPELRNSSSISCGTSWKNLAMAPSRYTMDWLSFSSAPLGSAKHQQLPPTLTVRMFSSLSASRGQIPEEDHHAEAAQDSDVESGSELEEYDWEDDEPEDLGNLEDLDSDIEDNESPISPQELRKSNGRESDYQMRIEAPVEEIYALLHSRGFITPKQKRPTPNDSVLAQEDYRIISWYRRVSIGLLNYYSCCDNFLKVKAIVNYQLRWSAIHTLSKKHKSSSRQVIQKYGKNLVVMRNGKTVASFLSMEEIKKHRKGFLEIDPVPPQMLIDVLYTRMKRHSREEKKQK